MKYVSIGLNIASIILSIITIVYILCNRKETEETE